MRRLLSSSATLWFAGSFLLSGVARAQARGNWTVAGSDSAHSNWQRAETKIAKETVAGQFKFLWKIKLGNDSSKSQSFSEPLLLPGLITGRGFKDLALWGDANTLYAVDSELGTLVWQKVFQSPSPAPQGACAGSNLQMVMEAPRIIHFGARRPPVPHAGPTTPPPAPASPSQRRIGVVPERGYFGLKGIYVLTRDGYLHEQILSTGLDYAPAVKFVLPPLGDPSALNTAGKLIYTETGGGCRNVPNAVWSIDLGTPAYAVNSYATKKVSLIGFA